MSKHTIKLVDNPVAVLEGGTGKQVEYVITGKHVLKPTTKQKGFVAMDKHLLLNQSEIKLLQHILLLTDDAILETKEEQTELRELLWQVCDPAQPDTEPAFKHLNKVKQELRKLRKLRAKVAAINTKLKKQAKLSV